MILDEINNMLDRQCIFSFSVNSSIEEFLAANGLTAIIRIRVTKDGGYAVYNFENDGFDEEELLKNLSEFDPQVTEDAVMFKVDLKGSEFLDAFKTLNKVPSVVIDSVIYNGGSYFIYFRFHSNDEKKVGTALKSGMVKFKRFAVRFLGKSSGIISTYREISSAIPLKYVEIRSSVPPSVMSITKDAVLKNLGVSWCREMKYLLEDEVRAVYYDKTALLRGREDWLNEISASQRIYETSFSNRLIQHLVTQNSQAAIVTLGMPQRLHGKTFSIATVVPEMVLPEFFSVVMGAIEEFKDWNLDIHYVDLFENMSTE